ARAAVDEQRVVGLRGGLRDRRRSGLRETVGGADHEGVEGVLTVQTRILAQRALGGGRVATGGGARGRRGGPGERGEAGVGAGIVGGAAAVVAVGREALRSRRGGGADGAGVRHRRAAELLARGQDRALVTAERCGVDILRGAVHSVVHTMCTLRGGGGGQRRHRVGRVALEQQRLVDGDREADVAAGGLGQGRLQRGG